MEQTAREVVDNLKRLSFAPSPPVRRKKALAVDLHNCPFRVAPDDPDGPVVCAFHEGLVRGLAEAASGEEVGVKVVPFAAPGVCRVELSPKETPPVRKRARPPA